MCTYFIQFLKNGSDLYLCISAMEILSILYKIKDTGLKNTFKTRKATDINCSSLTSSCYRYNSRYYFCISVTNVYLYINVFSSHFTNSKCETTKVIKVHYYNTILSVVIEMLQYNVSYS